MSADAVPTVRTSARYLNDRTRYPILLGRTVPQALGIGGGALLLIAVWNLAAGLGWDGTPRVVHLILLILAAASPYQVATIFYSGAGEPYARQHVGFARRWLRRRTRIVAGRTRIVAGRTRIVAGRTRIVAGHARARGPRVARAWVAGVGARAHEATGRGRGRVARPRIPGRVKRGRNT